MDGTAGCRSGLLAAQIAEIDLTMEPVGVAVELRDHYRVLIGKSSSIGATLTYSAIISLPIDSYFA